MIVRELLSLEDEDIDDDMQKYLEGSKDLMRILTVAGSNKNSSIITLREDRNKKAFFFFTREFLPCVVKQIFFRQNKLENLLSEYVMVQMKHLPCSCWKIMYLDGKLCFNMVSVRVMTVCHNKSIKHWEEVEKMKNKPVVKMDMVFRQLSDTMNITGMSPNQETT
jgi:hypothetical protein